MKHFYKAGGGWRYGDVEYTAKTVSIRDYATYENDPLWFSSLDALVESGGSAGHVEQEEPEAEYVDQDPEGYERQLREQIKALGAKAGGRSSIATLEKQLEELQNGDSN